MKKKLDNMSLSELLAYKDDLMVSVKELYSYLGQFVKAHKDVGNIIQPHQPEPVINYNIPPIQQPESVNNDGNNDLGMILTSTIDPLEELRARVTNNELSIHNES
jgi:hypothetical protein